MPAIGYICAVTASALCFSVLIGISSWLGGFESATQLPMITSLFHLLVMQFIVFICFWIAAFVLALIPLFVTLAISKIKRCESVFYFGICGLLTAAILDPVYITMSSGWMLEPPNPLTPVQQWARVAQLLLPCGLVGGIAYWVVAVRPKRVAAAPSSFQKADLSDV